MSVKTHDPLLVESLRDDFHQCRTFMHNWYPFIATDVDPPQDGWLVTARCETCTTVRFDVRSFHDGSLIRRRYDYPQGYELDEKVTRSELFMEYARRNSYEFINQQREKRRSSNGRK
jgi:hypothetical protein